MECKLECSNCHETNLNYFKFGSLDTISPQAKMNPMFGNNYEWIPKIPIGFYFKCSKCGKDTVVIPDNFGHREYSQEIPEQNIIRPMFTQPEFSITHYIMYDATGLLDQVVLTQNNTIVSLNTRQVIINDGSWHEITPTMFAMFKSKGFEEVGIDVQSTGNGYANLGSIDRNGELKKIPREMDVNDGQSKTTRVAESKTNATSTT